MRNSPAACKRRATNLVLNQDQTLRISGFLSLQRHGTLVVKEHSVRGPIVASRKRLGTLHKVFMKAITPREFVSLALIAITAPVLALGLVIAVRTVAVGNESLLLALTLCGAAVSGLNGFGRRTPKVESQTRGSRGGPQSSVALTS